MSDAERSRARRRAAPPNEADRAILRALESGPKAGSDIAAVTGLQGKGLGSRLHSLRLRGFVSRDEMGRWVAFGSQGRAG